MIRYMEVKDLDMIAQGMLSLRAISPLKHAHCFQPSHDDLVKWLFSLMTLYDHICYVKEQDEKVVAVIGCSLEHTKHPPHTRYVYEWCMFGEDKKDLADVWRVCKQWGKERGALLAQRGMQCEDGEKLHWEVLT